MQPVCSCLACKADHECYMQTIATVKCATYSRKYHVPQAGCLHTCTCMSVVASNHLVCATEQLLPAAPVLIDCAHASYAADAASKPAEVGGVPEVEAMLARDGSSWTAICTKSAKASYPGGVASPVSKSISAIASNSEALTCSQCQA